jgi:hypothetical protein
MLSPVGSGLFNEAYLAYEHSNIEAISDRQNKAQH